MIKPLVKGTSKSSLRQQLRSQRREISAHAQRLAAEQFCALVFKQPFFNHSRTLAFYSANDGELDLTPLMQRAYRVRKQIFLPALQQRWQQRLLFLPLKPSTSMRANRFDILEPALPWSHARPCWALDVVFFPLVGFDRQGNRLGMGGGFYDQTFGDLNQRPSKPLLIGVGHHCQAVESLPVDTWDVPLDAIITDKEIVFAKSKYKRKFVL